jgi:hypothetical protein
MADTIFIHDDGIAADLNSITGKAPTPIGNGILRLFVNPHVDDHTQVLGAFVEASFPGYAPIALFSVNWAAAGVGGHVASAAYGAASAFTQSAPAAPQQIYGWYITDGPPTKLYASALFTGGPIPMTNTGDQITVTPTLTDQSLN